MEFRRVLFRSSSVTDCSASAGFARKPFVRDPTGDTDAVNVSVVIPCYASCATLPSLVERLHASLPHTAEAFEIILVIDGSPDDTYAVARALGRERPETTRTSVL